jgi:hypothetical protein
MMIRNRKCTPAYDGLTCIGLSDGTISNDTSPVYEVF